MTAYRLTDAQLAKALRTQLPAAPAGLRSEILVAVEQTPQQRALPSLIGALTDADTVARRRVLLLAAAAVLALSTLVAAAVGALLEWQRPPSIPVVMPDASSPTTSLPSARPATAGDVLILDAYTGLVDSPPFRLEFRVDDGGMAFVYNGDGILRREHLGTPASVAIHRAGVETWHPLSYVAIELGMDGWMCDEGWQALEEAELVGRSVQRVRCEFRGGAVEVVRELWIDLETGIPLRTEQWQDGESVNSLVATAFEVGPQLPALFEPGPGATARPQPSAADPAVVGPPPAPDQGGAPADLAALVERTVAGYRNRAIDLTLRPPTAPGSTTYRWATNGKGALFEQTFSPNFETAIVFLWATDGNVYESYPQPDGSMKWRPWGPAEPDWTFTFPLEPPIVCSVGWRHLGVDLVLDRPADHIACAFREYWIDREWQIVVRAHDRDPLLDPEAGASWVTSVRFEAPDELLQAPPPDSWFWPYPTP